MSLLFSPAVGLVWSTMLAPTNTRVVDMVIQQNQNVKITTRVTKRIMVPSCGEYMCGKFETCADKKTIQIDGIVEKKV